MNSSNTESPRLDFLRAVAVMLVLGAHLCRYHGNPVLLGKLEPSFLGRMGVILFFVHTCLVLMMSLERQTTAYGWRNWISVFYLRRAFRIFPLSIAAVGLTYWFGVPVGSLGTYKLEAISTPGVGVFFANLTLTQNFIKDANYIEPLWSLPYEVQMYLVLPFCFLLCKRLSTHAMHLLWSVLAFAAFIIEPKVIVLNKMLSFWQMPHFLLYGAAFWAGIVAYRASFETKARLPFYVFPIMVATSALMLLFTYEKTSYIFVAYVCGCALPYIAEPRSKWLNKTSLLIARYSFGIYIFHYFSMWLGFEVLRDESALVQWGTFAVSLAGFCLAGYHFIEKPGIRLGHRMTAKMLGSAPKEVKPLQARSA